MHPQPAEISSSKPHFKLILRKFADIRKVNSYLTNQNCVRAKKSRKTKLAEKVQAYRKSKWEFYGEEQSAFLPLYKGTINSSEKTAGADRPSTGFCIESLLGCKYDGTLLQIKAKSLNNTFSTIL